MVIDFSLDQLTKSFIGISNPPWNKGDGLYLSDIIFPDIMAPLTNAYLIYLLSSRGICPTTTWPIFPGILAEPKIANHKDNHKDFFLFVQMLSLDQWMASTFFDTHGTHVNHWRSHNQCYQHQQFQWTLCLVDFCWTFLIQLFLSKHSGEILSHSFRVNEVFESNILLKENSKMLRTVFWFDWNILFYYRISSNFPGAY